MRKTYIPLYAGLGIAGLALLLAGCQTLTATQRTTAPSSALPTPPASGAVHYSVDAAHSQIVFLVYKAGALASFGHNHTVEAHDFQGDIYLAPDFKDSSLSLTLSVKSFEVDRAEARAAEGADFASHPSQQAIQGTTEHMLGADSLDVEHFPTITIQSLGVTGTEAKTELSLRITLHGTARDLILPVSISREGDELSASGSFDLTQSEFGITPYSALGGGLQVADTLKVHFRITAHQG